MKELIYDIIGIGLILLVIANVNIPQVNNTIDIGTEIETQQQNLLTAIR